MSVFCREGTFLATSGADYTTIVLSEGDPHSMSLQQRTYHGPVEPEDLARALIADLDGLGLESQTLGDPDHLVVQFGIRDQPRPGGRTSLTVHLIEFEDGVMVRLGEQQWLGVAASLGTTALMALKNPFSLIGRIDDVAQDIQSLGLRERVWSVIEDAARGLGASLELSETLRRASCAYCATANPVGAPSCLACGAPMGKAQPVTCAKCGYAVPARASECPQCATRVSQVA